MQRMQCFIFMGCWVKKGSGQPTVLGRARAGSSYRPRPIHRKIIFTRTRAQHSVWFYLGLGMSGGRKG
jgi:hypothetical protein